MKNEDVSLGEDVAELLRSCRDGNEAAAGELAKVVYGDLCRMAHRRLGSYKGPTLDTVGLVGEVYIRIIERSRYQLNDRKHFFCVAARVMRQIICDAARKRHSEKRGGVMRSTDIEEHADLEDHEAEWLLDLDLALDELAREDPAAARLVELKYFAGLQESEIAEAMDLSLRKVQRLWSDAKTILQSRLGAGAGSVAPAEGSGAERPVAGAG